jgi:acyl carrier protein
LAVSSRTVGGTPVDRQGIEDWLVAEIASRQGIDPEQVDTGGSFIANGLDSAASVALVGDLATMLGVTLPETLLWEYPSIVALAEHLAGVDQSSHGGRPSSGE